MVQKIFCDKCGKEMKGSTHEFTMKQFDKKGDLETSEAFDFCFQCATKIRKNIKP